MLTPQPIRVIRIVEITEYAPAPQPAARPVAALPRGYDAETDSPLAGRINPKISWTGPLSPGEVEGIRQRVEAARPRRRWFR